MRMPGIGIASPSMSRSTPAMMRISEDLPEPFRPSRPIFAPGKNEREMSFRICRLGGTILPTRLREYTYCAMDVELCGKGYGVSPGQGVKLQPLAGLRRTKLPSGHCLTSAAHAPPSSGIGGG